MSSIKSNLFTYLAFTFLVVFLQPVNAQDKNKTSNEFQTLVDSLRKQKIPEKDIHEYAAFLFRKKHAPNHTHTTAKLNNPSPVQPMASACYNPDFELGNFTNWTGYTGSCCPILAGSPGIVPGQHTIVSGTTTDPYTQGTITYGAPGGGDFSARLGNDNVGSQAERLTHSFLVTKDNTSFTYQYAVILQDPQHEPEAQPRFEVKVLDVNNNILPCGYYQVTAAGTIPGFVSIGDIRYKDWTTVGIDLTSYIGQTITIEFSTGDCGYGGHFGYAYIDATCEPLKIKKKFCKGDATAVLTAPKGFASYHWSTGHTGQTITINNPHKGDTVWANLNSVTGCPTKLYAVLIEERTPENLIATGDTLICPGQKVELKSTSIGGDTYEWKSIPNNNVVSTEENAFVSPTLTTNYLISVSNSCGKIKDTVKVSVKPYAPLVATNDFTLCEGLSSVLSVTGGTNYTWSPSTGLSCTNCANPVASPTQNITYTVSNTDTLTGCVISDSVKIKIDKAVKIEAFGTQSLCKGKTTYIGANAQNGTTYHWYPSTGLSCDTCLFTFVAPDSTTTYTIIAQNSCSSDTDKVVITVHPLPVIAVSPKQWACYGDSVIISASGGDTYQWSPGTGMNCDTCTTTTVQALGNITYYVSVSNTFGCYNSDTVKVAMKSLFNAITGDQTICEGTSVALHTQGADSLQPISWYPNTGLSCSNCATTVASPITSTMYHVIGNDSTSCKGIDSIYISVLPLPIANAGPDKDVCIGSYTYLPGSGGDTYQWYPASGLSCTTCSNPQTSPATNATYYMVAINMCGSDTDEVNIAVHPLPVVKASNDASVCSQSSTLLSVSGANTYSWYPSADLTCATCSTTSALIINTTTFYVEGTDSFGCASVDTVKITALPLPVINAGNDVSICIGDSVKLSPSGQINQPTWSPSGSLSCSNCASPMASPSATTTYAITVTHPTNGCKKSDQVKVTVNLPPTINAGTDQTICQGASAVLNATAGGGNANFSWVPVNVSCVNCITTSTTPSQTTTYSIIASNACGIDTDQVLINVLSAPVVTIGKNQQGCSGDVFQLSASGGGNYAWWPAAGLSCVNCSNPQATVNSDMVYQVIVSNNNGCSSTAEVQIKVDTKPLIDPKASYALSCDGLKTEFKSNGLGADSYYWNFGDGNTSTDTDPVNNYPNENNSYLVELTATNGACSNKKTLNITTATIAGSTNLFIPNVFSPNGDGVNDWYKKKADSASAVLMSCGTISIYNRWGNKVHEGKLNECWNATDDNNGKAVTTGTYFYIISFGETEYKGFITVLYGE